MLYKEFKPSRSLEQYIDTIWMVKNSGMASQSRITPDGFVDLIFNFGEKTPTLPAWNIGLSGMMTRYRDVSSVPNSELIGIRFKPGQFRAISNFQLAEIKNHTIYASEIIPAFSEKLLEQVAESKNMTDKIVLIETAIKKLITDFRHHSLITSVCHSIEMHYQVIDLKQIADNHYISLRQLERHFKASVGLTMKEYHSIVRYNKVLNSIAEMSEQSLLHTAFDHGFFDHAHLTKELKRIGGTNPSLL